ncbi:hypothetical protein AAFN86_28900 [Roseomonas sp. CAU 1739]|uniref:hypothetical protein n=1 Tax=Roseomonas sp. CAU 1739 TaxID=3140364 RepID=UPI00325AB93F
MPQLVQFDLAQVDVYEAQAALLALIAWPEDAPGSDGQSEAQVALVSRMFRTATEADPTFAHKRILVRLVYVQNDTNKMISMADRTYERLNRNLVALRILRPFAQQALFGENAPPLPVDLAQLSLNAATAWVTTRAPGSPDPHSFEHKVVRPLYPVLHLGMALDMILHNVEQARGNPPKPEVLMTDPELMRDMIDLARHLEPKMLAIRQFKVVEESQVRIRLLG